MSLTQKNKSSKIKFSQISEHSKGLLKEILSLFSVKFKISKESNCDDGKYLFSCVGCCMDNKNRVEGI